MRWYRVQARDNSGMTFQFKTLGRSAQHVQNNLEKKQPQLIIHRIARVRDE